MHTNRIKMIPTSELNKYYDVQRNGNIFSIEIFETSNVSDVKFHSGFPIY